jgi:hypothetical protein
MLVRTKRLMASFFASALLLAGLAAPAGAQQQGLVNVNIENVANDTQVAVTVPINAAANICGVSVDILSAAFAPTGLQSFDCDARANQDVTVSER